MNLTTPKEPIPLILNMPHLVSPFNKLISGLITILFWAFFVYLWLPLLTLAIGAIGYHTIYDNLYAQDMNTFKHISIAYGLIILALGGSLLMWALQEYLRFRNVNRRHRPVAVKSKELARYAKMKEKNIDEWQTIRRLVAHHDENGTVAYFDSPSVNEDSLQAQWA